MRRRWVHVVLALSLLFNVSALGGAWFQVWRTDGGVERSLFGMGHDRVPDYLKLNDAQRVQWRAMEQEFVRALNESGNSLKAHRERMVREILADQPDAAVIERERAAIFALQEAQQRSVIAQLLKEREMLNAEQRLALGRLMLEQ